MVRSPLMAARATFALKAGEWFRRGRLLMVSPVHGDYCRIQAEIPLIALCRFPGPALLLEDADQSVEVMVLRLDHAVKAEVCDRSKQVHDRVSQEILQHVSTIQRPPSLGNSQADGALEHVKVGLF